MTITIYLAGAPMAKERVRVTREGHAYTPERTMSYEARLAHAAQLVMAGRSPLAGPLKVELHIHVPIPQSRPKKWREAAQVGSERPTRKPDWDNFAKILDALNHIVWIDDAQIVDGRVVKYYSDRPSFTVKVDHAGLNWGIFS